jgi:hypothetical protein
MYLCRNLGDDEFGEAATLNSFPIYRTIIHDSTLLYIPNVQPDSDSVSNSNRAESCGSDACVGPRDGNFDLIAKYRRRGSLVKRHLPRIDAGGSIERNL